MSRIEVGTGDREAQLTFLPQHPLHLVFCTQVCIPLSTDGGYQTNKTLGKTNLSSHKLLTAKPQVGLDVQEVLEVILSDQDFQQFNYGNQASAFVVHMFKNKQKQTLASKVRLPPYARDKQGLI